jgi:hypothetical protein
MQQKVLVKSAWGSEGHAVQIFLLGEAVSVMRSPVAQSIVPVGWPRLSETLSATVALGIPIHV